MLQARAPVQFVGWIAGEWRHLTTQLLSADPNAGLAVFEGPGEPLAANELGCEAAG